MSNGLTELALVVILAAWLWVIYKQWVSRRKGTDFYLDNVIAYRVGLIQKKAKENDVKMVCPPTHDDFMDNIDADVESDINDLSRKIE